METWAELEKAALPKIQENLRELIEQAAACSGAASEERKRRRIAKTGREA